MPRYSALKKARFLLQEVLFGKGRFGHIFFTKKCDLDCPYCRVAERETKDISLGSWKLIVDRLSRWGVTYAIIAGGEPIIRKDLEELISYLRRLNIFSRVVTNGGLLTAERIESLARAGLCSLAISLDSLGSGEEIKSDSERIFYLLDCAKRKGIVPAVRAVMNPNSSEKTVLLAEETVRRGFSFGFCKLQAVGGLHSRPSRFSPVIGGMAQNRQGIWLPSGRFQEEPGIYATWKCNSGVDDWITVNNDGTLMPCQEWGSELQLLEIEDLDDARWRDCKRRAVHNCPGCSYDCYIRQEAYRHRPLSTIREELRTLVKTWQMLH